MDREIRLEPSKRAPGEAREFVGCLLREFGCPGLVADAQTIVTELVTNSVREAPAGPVWVDLRRIGRRSLLEVWDCSVDAPVFKDPDFAAERGRGLHIVAALSAGLGWNIFSCGKVVWALLR